MFYYIKTKNFPNATNLLFNKERYFDYDLFILQKFPNLNTKNYGKYIKNHFNNKNPLDNTLVLEFFDKDFCLIPTLPITIFCYQELTKYHYAPYGFDIHIYE